MGNKFLDVFDDENPDGNASGTVVAGPDGDAQGPVVQSSQDEGGGDVAGLGAQKRPNVGAFNASTNYDELWKAYEQSEANGTRRLIPGAVGAMQKEAKPFGMPAMQDAGAPKKQPGRIGGKAADQQYALDAAYYNSEMEDGGGNQQAQSAGPVVSDGNASGTVVDGAVVQNGGGAVEDASAKSQDGGMQQGTIYKVGDTEAYYVDDVEQDGKRYHRLLNKYGGGVILAEADGNDLEESADGRPYDGDLVADANAANGEPKVYNKAAEDRPDVNAAGPVVAGPDVNAAGPVIDAQNGAAGNGNGAGAGGGQVVPGLLHYATKYGVDGQDMEYVQKTFDDGTGAFVYHFKAPDGSTVSVPESEIGGRVSELPSDRRIVSKPTSMDELNNMLRELEEAERREIEDAKKKHARNQRTALLTQGVIGIVEAITRLLAKGDGENVTAPYMQQTQKNALADLTDRIKMIRDAYVRRNRDVVKSWEKSGKTDAEAEKAKKSRFDKAEKDADAKKKEYEAKKAAEAKQEQHDRERAEDKRERREAAERREKAADRRQNKSIAAADRRAAKKGSNKSDENNARSREFTVGGKKYHFNNSDDFIAQVNGISGRRYRNRRDAISYLNQNKDNSKVKEFLRNNP